jgi:hypothetical protein
MKTSADYAAHSRECADLAERFPPGRDRDWLIHLAELWEKMAQDRAKLVERRAALASGRSDDLGQGEAPE